jgi:beta-phosphoglucomutase
MENKIKALIFDLDGVIVDTTQFHFNSWVALAKEMGFEIPQSLDEELKGLGRIESLQKVLEHRDTDTPRADWPRLAARKNELYLSNISHLSAGDTLPGLIEFLKDARAHGMLLAIGSGSKNARPILARLEITDMFNIICDGTDTGRSKPDPEVFQCACRELGVSPGEAIVFEDAVSGIEAALSCGTRVVGIGESSVLNRADLVLPSLEHIKVEDILQKLPKTV